MISTAVATLLALWRNRDTDEGRVAWYSHVRRWFGYALILLLLVTSSLAISNYVKTLKQDNAIVMAQASIRQYQDALDQQVAINKSQDDTIQRIGEVRELDGSVLASLQTDLGRLRARDSALNDKLTALEKSNAQVRALMSTPTSVVPGGGCVLDNSCAQSNGANQNRGVDDPQKPAGNLPEAKNQASGGSARLRDQLQCPTVGIRRVCSKGDLHDRLVTSR